MEAMKRDVDYFIDSCLRHVKVIAGETDQSGMPTRSPPVFQWEKIIDTLGLFPPDKDGNIYIIAGDRLFLLVSSFPVVPRLQCRQQLELSDHFQPVSEHAFPIMAPSRRYNRH
jgi:hypothetical protein